MRGLAISNYEDKIVQLAMKKLIEAIFDQNYQNACMDLDLIKDVIDH